MAVVNTKILTTTTTTSSTTTTTTISSSSSSLHSSPAITAAESDYSTLIRTALEAKLYYIRDTIHPVHFDELVDAELLLYQQRATEEPVGFRIFVRKVSDYLRGVREKRGEGKEEEGEEDGVKGMEEGTSKKGSFVGGIKLKRERMVEDLWASCREV